LGSDSRQKHDLVCQIVKAYDVVKGFEERVAEYAGSRYAVATDCCTSALFLSLKYIQNCCIHNGGPVLVPAKTYISVPQAVIHAGFQVEFTEEPWTGVYQLKPHPVWDGAKRFSKGMYQGGLHCLSFHVKKLINIGRGGMVLTEDGAAATWLRKARYDGREGLHYPDERVSMLGWHCYMNPSTAAQGILRLHSLPRHNAPLPNDDYPDLSQMEIFK